MTITIVKINPRQEMRLECEWCHTQKRWAENLEDFEKDSVEFRPWCWEVGFRPWCWEFGSDHGVENLGPTMVLRIWVRPWCQEVEVSLWSWGFEIGPCRQIIELLPLGQRMEFSAKRIEFSTVGACSWNFADLTNRDLKHYKMRWTLVGVR